MADGEIRTRTMTEQGEQRYATLKEEHLKQEEAIKGKINAEIAKIPDSNDDAEALQAIDKAIRELAAKHKTVTMKGEDFFKRTSTVQSHADGADFAKKDCRNYPGDSARSH